LITYEPETRPVDHTEKFPSEATPVPGVPAGCEENMQRCSLSVTAPETAMAGPRHTSANSKSNGLRHSSEDSKLGRPLHAPADSLPGRHNSADSKLDGHSPAAPNGLASCVYIALRCSHCGELRQALSQPPGSETVLCPACGMACSFVLLGKGRTSRKLPFHEIHNREGSVLTPETLAAATPAQHRQH
jgi:hypothetical protein